MADIYDNSPERKFVEGLKKNITAIGVKRVDFCIGYFNLRGWDQIADEVDTLQGETIYELDEFQQDVRKNRFCRLLIGMHRPDEELIRELYSCREPEPIDNEQMLRCKLKIAAEFQRQLMLGAPTNKDEQTLRHLAEQLREGRVCVKLYLRRLSRQFASCDPVPSMVYRRVAPVCYPRLYHRQEAYGERSVYQRGLFRALAVFASIAEGSHTEKLYNKCQLPKSIIK